MNSFLMVLLLVGLVHGQGISLFDEKHGEREQHEERHKHEQVSSAEKVLEEIGLKEEGVKEKLIKKKSEEFAFDKGIEFYLKNPNVQFERECFASNVQTGQTVDFVIDIAPSPSLDEVDKLAALSPVALYLERKYREPSRAYFSAIQLFIDIATLEMKPERTHTVIYENGRKFYLHGRKVEETSFSNVGDFADKMRNLKTLWPRATKEVSSHLYPIVKNNLGYLTYLALWNRDNGLPSVLASTRRSKPVYTIVITDGASGAHIKDLTEDLSRTTVIDVGNYRFVKNLKWEEIREIVSVFTLIAPQQLPMMADTCRLMACRLAKASHSSM